MHVLMTRVTKLFLALMMILVLGGLFVLVAWAAISLAQPPITHPGPDGAGNPGEFPDCLACHQAGVAGAPRLASDHVAHRNDDCLICHDYLGHPDAATAHATLLVGRHVEAWCEDCHAGVQRPGVECASCHEPPSEPHFGPVCEDCHTPAGFAESARGEFEHVVPLEGAHAELNCADCHVGDEELVYECASCHEPPSEPHFGPVCEDCHTPAGFAESAQGEFEHVVPLEGAHAELNCADCHVGDEELVYECAECHEPPSEPHFGAACEDCHTPEGWPESAASILSLAPEIAHELEGREDCLLCHDPEGQILPAPSDHADYANEQCTTCHQVAP